VAVGLLIFSLFFNSGCYHPFLFYQYCRICELLKGLSYVHKYMPWICKALFQFRFPHAPRVRMYALHLLTEDRVFKQRSRISRARLAEI
jgi:hypothetical protein